MIKKEPQRRSCTLGFVLWIQASFLHPFFIREKKSKWQSIYPPSISFHPHSSFSLKQWLIPNWKGSSLARRQVMFKRERKEVAESEQFNSGWVDVNPATGCCYHKHSMISDTGNGILLWVMKARGQRRLRICLYCLHSSRCNIHCLHSVHSHL